MIICLVVEVGLVGGFIEDVSGCVGQFIYEFFVVLEWVVVVVEVVCVLLFLFIFCVCVENFLYGCEDFDDILWCLCVYVDVGVDVFYVFGLNCCEQIVVVFEVVVLKLINVLVGLLCLELLLDELEVFGVKCVSLGLNFVWVVFGVFYQVVQVLVWCDLEVICVVMFFDCINDLFC